MIVEGVWGEGERGRRGKEGEGEVVWVARERRRERQEVLYSAR